MSTVLADLARSEHTGENRCWPCTVANLLLLGVGSLAVALLSPVAGALLAVAGIAVIWVRGYLIPYTPVFAPRLAARLPYDPFHARGYPDDSSDHSRGTADSKADPDQANDREVTDDDREPGTLADATTEDGEAILQTLVEEGIVRVSDDDIVLDEAFEERWHDEMRSLRDAESEQLADAARSVAPGDAEAHLVTERGRTYVVLSDGSDDPRAESWLRQPVAIAETAAARALSDAGLDSWRSAVAAHALCIFLEACPVCDTELAERPAGGCCGPPKTDADGRPLQALVCPNCRVQFAEFD